MNILLLTVGVSSRLFHSIYSAISKSLLKHRIREPFLFFLYISILQTVITPLLWLFVKPAIPPTSGWTPLLMAGITGVISFLFLYSALTKCGYPQYPGIYQGNFYCTHKRAFISARKHSTRKADPENIYCDLWHQA